MKLVLALLLISSCTITKQPSSRFCGVVENIRYGKKTSNIKPQGTRYWFRYESLNVRIGDTVELNRNNRIEPKF